MRQTLQGTFSAVSKRNFASKYAFESSRRDLHNALLCTALKSHWSDILSKIAKIFRNFAKSEALIADIRKTNLAKCLATF